MMDMNGMISGMMAFGWLGLLLGIAILVLLGVGIARLVLTQGGAQSDALDMAKRRYAKGEISQEEFNDMKRNLS